MMRTCFLVIAGGALLTTAPVRAGGPSFLSTLHHINTLVSTVPGNGDVNPYGVAVVPVTMGALTANNVLVSNFNNSGNLQGTGSTIVQITPGGNISVFAQLTSGACADGIGLTTALVALKSGFVVVGSLPTTDGTAATAKAGCLIVLDSSGTVVTTLTGHGINGPWDMTALDMGNTAELFVANVLNGTVAANGAVVSQGSILRIGMDLTGTPSATSFTTIASAFEERTDPNALVIGPTGLGLGADGSTLFVADTLQNRIAAIPNAVSTASDAGDGVTVAQGRALRQPLGITIAPNGDIVTVNASDGLIVETTPSGMMLGARFVDVSHSKNGAGTLFGLATRLDGRGIYLVNDGNNTLNVLQ